MLRATRHAGGEGELGLAGFVVLKLTTSDTAGTTGSKCFELLEEDIQ